MINSVKVNQKGQYVFEALTYNSADILRAYPAIASRMTPALYAEIMGIFGDSIIARLKKEMTRLMGIGVIPKSKSLYESFGYRLDTKLGNLVFYSTWDKANIYVAGRDSYKMSWLTKQKGVNRKIPMKDKEGKLVFRTVPLTTNQAWVHPGIQRFSFFAVAIEEGRWNAVSKVTNLLIKKGLYL